MGALQEDNQFIDVICEFTKDGRIIPMRIRVQDSDGIFHVFNIKAYKELSSPGPYKTQHDVTSHTRNWRFTCRIQVFNTYRNVELFFNAVDNRWKIVSITA